MRKHLIEGLLLVCFVVYLTMLFLFVGDHVSAALGIPDEKLGSIGTVMASVVLFHCAPKHLKDWAVSALLIAMLGTTAITATVLCKAYWGSWGSIPCAALIAGVGCLAVIFALRKFGVEARQ